MTNWNNVLYTNSKTVFTKSDITNSVLNLKKNPNLQTLFETTSKFYCISFSREFCFQSLIMFSTWFIEYLIPRKGEKKRRQHWTIFQQQSCTCTFIINNSNIALFLALKLSIQVHVCIHMYIFVAQIIRMPC